MKKKNFLHLLFIAMLIPFIASCSDDNDEPALTLESYNSEINFGETKYIAVTTWEGDRSKVTATVENERILYAEIVESKENEVAGDILYVRLLGVGDGETSVIIKDEKGNQVVLQVKAIDELAGFKADDTARLLLDDDKYKINLRKGDTNGGQYTFGREGNIVTFKWENKENNKSATITYTEDAEDRDFSFDVHRDAVLTLVNPDAPAVEDRKVVLNLQLLKAIGISGKLKQPEEEGAVSEMIPETVWILFRLPPAEGEDKGTVGYCVGSLLNE